MHSTRVVVTKIGASEVGPTSRFSQDGKKSQTQDGGDRPGAANGPFDGPGLGFTFGPRRRRRTPRVSPTTIQTKNTPPQHHTAEPEDEKAYNPNQNGGSVEWDKIERSCKQERYDHD